MLWCMMLLGQTINHCVNRAQFKIVIVALCSSDERAIKWMCWPEYEATENFQISQALWSYSEETVIELYLDSHLLG